MLKKIRVQYKEFMLINLGIFLIAFAIHFFKNPNRFALGGVSGLSLLGSFYFPALPIGSMMMAVNLILLVLAYFVLGKDAALKSAYGSFMLSGMVWLLEIIYPMSEPFTNQRFMELIYGVFLPGIGAAIVFNYGATTGGTDIVAKILTKHFKTKVSLSLLLVDFSIAFAAGLLFGREACLFSILGVSLKAFVIDSFMESLQISKIVVVISEKSDEIQYFICKNIQRGATVHTARGAYTDVQKDVITTVLSRRQAMILQSYIKSIDPEAFITITNSSRIIGKGFRNAS